MKKKKKDAAPNVVFIAMMRGKFAKRAMLLKYVAMQEWNQDAVTY